MDQNIEKFKSFLSSISEDVLKPSEKSIQIFESFDDEMKMIFTSMLIDSKIALSSKYGYFLRSSQDRKTVLKIQEINKISQTQADHDLQMNFEKKVYEFAKEVGLDLIKYHFNIDYSESFRQGNKEFFDPKIKDILDLPKSSLSLKTPKKTHYILIHETGGSMYEATCPQHIFGPYSKEEADAKEKEINDKIDEYMDDYFVVNRFDTSNPNIKISIDDILVEIEDNNDY